MRSLLLSLLLGCSTLAHAQIQTEEIPYTAADGTRLVGYLAWDDALQGSRPGVLVVHEWWGLNDYAKRRARDLAALGYSALAIDMYGEGRNTGHPEDAKAFMNEALADRPEPRHASSPAWICSRPGRRPTPAGWPPSATASVARWCWTWPGRACHWPQW